MPPLIESEIVELARLLDVLVPGAAAVGAERYAQIVLAARPAEQTDLVRTALAEARSGDGAMHPGGPAFDLLRALAVEAFYGDWVAPGAPGPSGWTTCGFRPARTLALAKDWSFLDGRGP